MRSKRMRGYSGVGVVAVMLAAGASHPVSAQEPVAPDSVQRELARMRAELDSLRQALARLEDAGRVAETEDAAARLRAAALAAAARASAEEAPAEQTAFTGRQRALQVLNPEISVGGDLLVLAQEEEPGRDNFMFREVEFAFQAVLDPFSRAKIIVSHHEHGGGLEPFPWTPTATEHEHGGLAVEEAYAQWVNLPGGLTLTLGRFRQRLGTYNRWHRHALPWQSLPMMYGTLLGEEGLAQTGASLYWLAPVHGFGTYEVWIEGMRGGNDVLFGESTALTVLGHLNAFYEPTAATYLELGVSGVAGAFEWDGLDAQRRLLHLEAALNWRPPGRELYREFTARAAILQSRGPVLVNGAALTSRTTTGGFAWIETRFGRRWLAGVRYDRIEDPTNPGSYAWLLAPTLTWWQSEFVRARAEYDWLHATDATRGQLLVQLTFAMGPHKHETY